MRGVIQSDIFSLVCFIIALEANMRRHGGGASVSALGVMIGRLEYADDAALVDSDCETASDRVTRLGAGASEDADMEIPADMEVRGDDLPAESGPWPDHGQ